MVKRENSSPINDNTGNFTVEIKNFGKIADAKLQFNGLTLLDAPYRMLYRQSKLLNPASKLNLLPN